jgi:predicted permease
MTQPKPSIADRFYRALLRLLPFDFRSEFGDDMAETFRDQRAHTGRDRGSAALLRMWWATIVDIARMAPREHMSVLWQDTRYALRMMRKNPGYTLAAVMILGLGIGANTSIFSVVNSVLLKPLPYLDGDRLVVLRQHAAKLGANDVKFSVAEIEDYRRQNRTLSALAEYHSMLFTLLGAKDAHRVRTGVVSSGFFDMFGVRPLLGRTFRPADDLPGAPAVLILSYEFWKSVEGGDPQIVGKTFQMNDRVHTVVGVLPPIPQYPDENDAYMPVSACPFRSSPQMIANRDSHMMSVFGRLKPGANLDHCGADLSVIARRLEQAYPKSYPKGLGFGIASFTLRDELTHHARAMLLLLLGAAAFVLLIACANVANLILARMARRERELMIRTAVGAGAGRLLRQLLTESLILALLAAGVGLLFASGSFRLLAEFAGQLTPRAREIAIDGWVLLFAVLCAGATTIVFGSMSALYSRPDLASGLKGSGVQQGTEGRRKIVRGGLIAAQVAFSYVLLIGAGLMVRSFIQLERVDPGFVPQRVFAVNFDLNWSMYNQRQGWSFAKRLLEKVQSRPGVLSAAVSTSFPMDPDTAGMNGWSQTFQIEGAVQSDAETPPMAAMRGATPGYFSTLGIPLVSGRTFRESDSPDASPVAVVSRALAHRRWGQQDPTGRRVSFDRGKTWIAIVGVVGDVKEYGLDRAAPEQFYRPMAQLQMPAAILVRTANDPEALSNQVRRDILDLDPQTAITLVKTLEEVRTDSVSSPRTTARLLGSFAGLALIVAVAGIGSMLALSVRQRVREIGIRMALGATPGDVLRVIVRQGMALVAIGMALGLAGSVALTGALKALLFEVTPTDLATYVLVSAVLAAAALLASYLPARRAARIDPQAALRCE